MKKSTCQYKRIFSFDSLCSGRLMTRLSKQRYSQATAKACSYQLLSSKTFLYQPINSHSHLFSKNKNRYINFANWLNLKISELCLSHNCKEQRWCLGMCGTKWVVSSSRHERWVIVIFSGHSTWNRSWRLCFDMLSEKASVWDDILVKPKVTLFWYIFSGVVLGFPARGRRICKTIYGPWQGSQIPRRGKHFQASFVTIFRLGEVSTRLGHRFLWRNGCSMGFLSKTWTTF